MTATAAAPAAEEQPDAGATSRRRFKAECRGCGRIVTRTSRRARTWTCPHEDCRRVNPGPGLTEELAQPPAPGTGTRRRRRAAAAEAPPPPGPAPVRRKSTKAAAAPAAHGAAGDPPPAGHAAPETGGRPAAASSTPPRRGLLDRIFYGDDGQDEGEE